MLIMDLAAYNEYNTLAKVVNYNLHLNSLINTLTHTYSF